MASHTGRVFCDRWAERKASQRLGKSIVCSIACPHSKLEGSDTEHGLDCKWLECRSVPGGDDHTFRQKDVGSCAHPYTGVQI